MDFLWLKKILNEKISQFYRKPEKNILNSLKGFNNLKSQKNQK